MSSNGHNGPEIRTETAENKIRAAEWYAQLNKLYVKFIFEPHDFMRKLSENILLTCFGQQSDIHEIWMEHFWRPIQSRIEEVAYLLWELAGRPPNISLDYWLSAEKYVIGITIAAIKATSLPIHDETILTERDKLLDKLDQLLRTFSPASYADRIRTLAQLMWRNAGQPVGIAPLVYWLVAERHILAVIAGAVRKAGAPAAVSSALIEAFKAFSPAEHLKLIERNAYFKWMARGSPYWDALTDWKEAEEELLKETTAIKKADESDGGSEPVPPS